MYSIEIENKMAAYYEHYYRETLCIPDWEKRVLSRHAEDDIEQSRLLRLGNVLGLDFYKLNNVLVVGAGTGGALIALKQLGVKNIYAIEPNTDAFEITMMKANHFGLDTNLLSQHTAESIPYGSGTFEFIYCFTVLEHVQNVTQTLNEMCRVLCPGGTLYINTPNYNYPYEGHYKIHAPTCFGILITSVYFFLIGKNSLFLKSLNFVTPRSIKNILKKIDNINYFWLHGNDLKNQRTKLTLRGIITYLMQLLGIEKNQELCVKKVL